MPTTRQFPTPDTSTPLPKLRKALSAPGLLGAIRAEFATIGDPRSGCTIPLVDALMAGLAVFGRSAAQVRGKVAIRNPIFAALCSYVHLQRMPFTELIDNVYRWHRTLYQEVIAAFVARFMRGKDYLNPQFHPAVNA